MDILEATKRYEGWLRRITPVVESQLGKKHARMRDDRFDFFRGTFYRWAALWPDVCPQLGDAPRLLAIGDIHVNSFGTWRDVEGRLCWGVNDFDEAYPLPYANDLVRLAASAKLARDDNRLALKFKDACEAILEGYRRALRDGGCPIVLGERDTNLEHIGFAAIEPAEDFWPRLQALHRIRRSLPADVRTAFAHSLPHAGHAYRVVAREAGVGSLGHRRFVAIATWQGGLVAREAKAVVPSACASVDDNRGRRERTYYRRALDGAVRSRDPFHTVAGSWRIRRLSPDANRIDLDDLPQKRDEETLLQAMGTETANVHLGSAPLIAAVLADLHRRKTNWLRTAAKAMAEAVHDDWKAFRKATR